MSEAEARLSRMLEAAERITRIGSWEWDVATGVVTWSDELYRIYGLEPRSCEITFDAFLARVHPEDRARVMGEITAAHERGGRFAHRERIVRPDGTVRELESMGEAVRDASGRVLGLIGTCRDITEARRREETIRLYADIVGGAQVALSMWRVDAPGDPGGARLVAFNPATVAAAELTGDTPTGRTLRDLLRAEPARALAGLFAGVGPAIPARELAAIRFADAPDARVFAAKAFVLRDGCVGLALEDVTARLRAERVQRGEQGVLELLAARASLAETLDAVARFIEDLAPGTIASLLLLDDEGRVRHGAAPSLPEAYRRAIDGLPIGPRAGSCGTAAFRRTPVYVADIATDPLWEGYRDLALPHGLRACWSEPIFGTDGRVLGTFALYRREPRLPDAWATELIGRATHIAKIAIERRGLDDELLALSRRVDEIREDERAGIARELHDVLGQELTALKMDLSWVDRRVRDPIWGEVGGKLADMIAQVDRLIQTVRRISAELRPAILDDLGLDAAIEWQAEDFQRRTGTRCLVSSGLGDLPLEPALAIGVFRIFQEALTNVMRHARAETVTVKLGLEHGRLSLVVADDGVGLPAALPRDSVGLIGMRERARRLGGECRVGRGEPRGTVVSLSVPIRSSTEARRTEADSKIGG
jgi:PAS domain S-box-containing protein